MPSYTLEQLRRSPYAAIGGITRLAGTTLNFGIFGANCGRIAQNMGSTATVVSTAGAATYTTAQLLAGVLRRDCNGAARTDVTPTAAQIVAAMPKCQVNDTFEFRLVSDNTSTAGNTVTLTGGTGVTMLTGGVPSTVAVNTARLFLVQISSPVPGAETVRILPV